MTVILKRQRSTSSWILFCNWITSTENRLYVKRSKNIIRTNMRIYAFG